MKRWQTLVPTLLLALLAATVTIGPALSQNDGDLPPADPGIQAPASEPVAPPVDAPAVAPPRKVVYLYSLDFPPDIYATNPIPALHETDFWRLMDKEMAQTPDLALTENLEEADYRVELRCSGIISCTHLVVDIKNPQRDVLASFTMKKMRPSLFGKPNLPIVAKNLTAKIDERINAMNKGDYGYSE